MPASELSNNSVPLECLWGRSSGWLRERLLAAHTSENRLRVLEQCLLEKLAPVAVHPVVGFALQQLITGRQVAISQLVERVGFSQRHFNQLFSDNVGLTPKLFSRVSRFQKVVQTVHANHEVDWADIALSCGYYDQAHFNHDFHSFAGMTPTGYQARRTEHVNHVPIVS